MLEEFLTTKPKRKLLSLFFAFPDRSFTLQEIHQTTKVSTRTISSTIRELVKVGILDMGVKNRHRLYRLNPKFGFHSELADLLRDEIENQTDQVALLLREVSHLKLAVLSGAFTFHPELPVDLLLVGERISRLRLEKILSRLNKLTGIEVAFAVMPESEYEYRRVMNDKFIRDILDYRHIEIVPKKKGRKK